jgi:ribosomal protein L37AE/L43A
VCIQHYRYKRERGGQRYGLETRREKGKVKKKERRERLREKERVRERVRMAVLCCAACGLSVLVSFYLFAAYTVSDSC